MNAIDSPAFYRVVWHRYKLPLSEAAFFLPGNRRLFLCEKQFEHKRSEDAKRDASRGKLPLNNDSVHSHKSFMSDDSADSVPPHKLGNGGGNGVCDPTATSVGFPDAMSPSALLGAMEGLVKDSRCAAFAALSKNHQVVQEIKRSTKRQVRVLWAERCKSCPSLTPLTHLTHLTHLSRLLHLSLASFTSL